MIHKKIIEILQKVEAIKKDKKNTQGNGYNYRGIDDMYNELHNLFSECGVFITSEVMKMTREERQSKAGGQLIYTILDLKFTFWADDGSCVSSIMVGEAMDSGDKSCNKAMSVALKYALMQMFLIPTKDLVDTNVEKDTYELSAKKPQFTEVNFENLKKVKDNYKNATEAIKVAKENFELSGAYEVAITNLYDPFPS